MNFLIRSTLAPTFLETWGERLLRACWQGALLIVVLAVLCRALPRLPASARCFLWWLACLKLLLSLVWTTPLGVPLLRTSSRSSPLPADSTAAARNSGMVTNPSGNQSLVSASAGSSSPLSTPGSTPVYRQAASEGAGQQAFAPVISPAARLWTLTLLFFAWLIGALLRLLLSLLPLRRVRQLLATATVMDDPDMQTLLTQIAQELGLRQAPCLLVSQVDTEPLAVSHWHTLVLLSRSDLERLDETELRAVLAHEFAHIRRADLWLGLIPFATQIVFWFHPFAWLACHEFVVSREAACDALALRAVRMPTRAYSALLLKLGTRHTPLGPALALGATSQLRLLQRRILMMHQTPRCSRRLLFVGLTALFVPVVGLGVIPWQVVAAQQTPQLPRLPLATQESAPKPEEAAGVQERKGPANLDFAQGLNGWRYDWADGSEPYFDHGIDANVRYNGRPSPFLHATANRPQIYGVISQWIDATPYHGKRLRFSAYLKTQGVKVYAGPMFGLVGGAHARNYIRKNQPVQGDTDWQRYEYVADIDADTGSLVLGMNLTGKGKVWMNHLSLEEVGHEVALSSGKLAYTDADDAKVKLPAHPVNLDFAKGLAGWSRVEEGSSATPSAYRIGLDRAQVQHGIPPAFLTSDGSQPNGYGTMVQYLDPTAYRGKRLRLSGLIKTQDVNKYAGLWVGLSGSEWSVWDAQHSAIQAPQEWTRVSLVLDVPQDCAALGLGVMIRGLGKLWVKRLTLEAVGGDVPTSPVTLRVPGGK